MEIGLDGVIAVDVGDDRLSVMAGRGGFVGLYRCRREGGHLGEADAMLRCRLDLSGEDKGRDERQHDAGQP